MDKWKNPGGSDSPLRQRTGCFEWAATVLSTTQDAGDPGSIPALGKQQSLTGTWPLEWAKSPLHWQGVPSPMLTFATKPEKLSTGANVANEQCGHGTSARKQGGGVTGVWQQCITVGCCLRLLPSSHRRFKSARPYHLLLLLIGGYFTQCATVGSPHTLMSIFFGPFLEKFYPFSESFPVWVHFA